MDALSADIAKVINPVAELFNQTIKIFESDLSWEDKYEKIFSTEISGTITRLIRLWYYDPDTSYEEDVTAFVQAFKDYMKSH